MRKVNFVCTVGQVGSGDRAWTTLKTQVLTEAHAAGAFSNISDFLATARRTLAAAGPRWSNNSNNGTAAPMWSKNLSSLTSPPPGTDGESNQIRSELAQLAHILKGAIGSSPGTATNITSAMYKKNGTDNSSSRGGNIPPSILQNLDQLENGTLSDDDVQKLASDLVSEKHVDLADVSLGEREMVLGTGRNFFEDSYSEQGCTTVWPCIAGPHHTVVQPCSEYADRVPNTRTTYSRTQDSCCIAAYSTVSCMEVVLGSRHRPAVACAIRDLR